MADNDSLLNKQQRKKARRKAKKSRERQAGRDLDAITTDAIEAVLDAAPGLSGTEHRHIALDGVVPESEAQFIRKRINERLMVEELLDVLRIDLVEGTETTGTELWLTRERF